MIPSSLSSTNIPSSLCRSTNWRKLKITMYKAFSWRSLKKLLLLVAEVNVFLDPGSFHDAIVALKKVADCSPDLGVCHPWALALKLQLHIQVERSLVDGLVDCKGNAVVPTAAAAVLLILGASHRWQLVSFDHLVQWVSRWAHLKNISWKRGDTLNQNLIDLCHIKKCSVFCSICN